MGRDAIRHSETERGRLGETEYRQIGYTWRTRHERIVLDDVSLIAIRRERGDLSQRRLAAAAEISPSYLAEIASRKKPGSVAASSRSAKALQVPMGHLVA